MSNVVCYGEVRGLGRRFGRGVKSGSRLKPEWDRRRKSGNSAPSLDSSVLVSSSADHICYDTAELLRSLTQSSYRAAVRFTELS